MDLDDAHERKNHARTSAPLRAEDRGVTDSELFRQLSTEWYARLLSLCERLTGNRHDAEDAVQEALFRACEARPRFRGGSAFSTWVWRIAVNAAHDVRRRQQRWADVESDDADIIDYRSSTETMTDTDEVVRDAVMRLSEELREVVVLRHYQGLRFREIAEILNLPLGTVCSRMTDALSRLSRQLRAT